MINNKTARPNILILEWSDGAREALCRFFTKVGFVVESCLSCEEALQKLEQGLKTDVIITALSSPDKILGRSMSGAQFMQTIFLDERWRDIPIVVYSCSHDYDMPRKWLYPWIVKHIRQHPVTPQFGKKFVDKVPEHVILRVADQLQGSGVTLPEQFKRQVVQLKNNAYSTNRGPR